MKYLSQFVGSFNWLAFSEGKQFRVIGYREWKDFESGSHLGTKVEVVIFKDETSYKQRDGEVANNLFEKLVFKVAKNIEIPINSIVEPLGVTATIFGEYRNQLSVKAEDIKILQQKGA